MKILFALLLGVALTAAFFTNPSQQQHITEYPAAIEEKNGTIQAAQAMAAIRDAEYQDYLLFSLMESKSGSELLGTKEGASLSLGLYGMIIPL